MCVNMFFFNDTATTEIYTLSLHDALPISWALTIRRLCACCSRKRRAARPSCSMLKAGRAESLSERGGDRKSTRLNSSHANISYAVFCLKKKKYKQAVTMSNNLDV